MSMLFGGAVFFVFIHLVVAGSRLRSMLVAAIGEGGFRLSFSLASILGLGWLIRGFNVAPSVVLWEPPLTRWPAFAALLPAFIFAVSGLLRRSPTGIGFEQHFEQTRGVFSVTRHPFLWAVALWALVHIVYAGDVAGVTFFGSFMLVAVVGTFSIDAKRSRAYGAGWETYATVTSNVPFGAMLEHRNRFAWRDLISWRALLAIAIYLLVLRYHGELFGSTLVSWQLR